MSAEQSTTENDEWRDISGFPRYRINRSGQVQSRGKGHWSAAGRWVPGEYWRTLTPSPNQNGYLRVFLTVLDDDRRRICTRYVHRLVMAAFVGPCPRGHDVRHLNGDPTDNRLENLQYGTRKENMADCKRHGTQQHGSKHYRAKLDEAKVAEILRLSAAGNSSYALAVKYKVSRGAICSIVRRKNWTHVNPQTAEEHPEGVGC